MKTNINKIFNRTKLVNNRLYQNQIKSINPEYNNLPNILSKISIQHLRDNMSVIRKQFDGDVAYFG